MQNDIHIAGNASYDTPADFQLFAGDAPVITSPDTIVTSATKYPQYSPLTRDSASGKLRLAVVAAGVPEPIVAITPYEYDATGGDLFKSNYTGGYFNIDAIVWPATFTTDALKIAAVDGTPIHFRKIH